MNKVGERRWGPSVKSKGVESHKCYGYQYRYDLVCGDSPTTQLEYCSWREVYRANHVSPRIEPREVVQ